MQKKELFDKDGMSFNNQQTQSTLQINPFTTSHHVLQPLPTKVPEPKKSPPFNGKTLGAPTIAQKRAELDNALQSMQEDLQRLRNRITQIERTSAQRSSTAVDIVRERQGALAQVTDQLTVSV